MAEEDAGGGGGKIQDKAAAGNFISSSIGILFEIFETGITRSPPSLFPIAIWLPSGEMTIFTILVLRSILNFSIAESVAVVVLLLLVGGENDDDAAAVASLLFFIVIMGEAGRLEEHVVDFPEAVR